LAISSGVRKIVNARRLIYTNRQLTVTRPQMLDLKLYSVYSVVLNVNRNLSLRVVTSLRWQRLLAYHKYILLAID